MVSARSTATSSCPDSTYLIAIRDITSARPSRLSMACAISTAQSRKLLPGSLSSGNVRSEEHTSELQSQSNLVCRLLLEKKRNHEGASTKMVDTLVNRTIAIYPCFLHLR